MNIESVSAIETFYPSSSEINKLIAVTMDGGVHLGMNRLFCSSL